MAIHPLAGQPVTVDEIINIPRLVTAYFTQQPDLSDPSQLVSFGTSGHRGSSLKANFTESHILAISQAICEHRQSEGITGPMYIGMDTHALSEPALVSAVEVFGANGVQICLQAGLGYTPTPVISHAILAHNRGKTAGLADGIVITPSHNPPGDGGFKYNPPSGGPASTGTTRLIQDRANEILRNGLSDVKRVPFNHVLASSRTHEIDFITPYVDDLGAIIDMEAIASSGIRLGVDPMGGAGIDFWAPIAERYGLNIDVVNTRVDPTFSFMTLDRDGKIRMDCSSSYAMASLIGLKDKYDISFGNDPDFDRHGIVTRSSGLMNPNHYLAVAIQYLFQTREWKPKAAIGKTLVSSSMIDRVAKKLNRTLYEVPVGFKWFVDGLIDGDLGFGGEESAGAAFLRNDGTVWTTDKDGFIMDLLAAEILAKTGRDPGEHYADLEAEFGRPVYERIDAPANTHQKAVLASLSPQMIRAFELAGDKITGKFTNAPGNKEAIGGLKVTSSHGWFAARPSGTEDVYKIYAESFRGAGHLKQIQDEAREIVRDALEDGEL